LNNLFGSGYFADTMGYQSNSR